MKIESKITFNKTRNTYQAKVTIPTSIISKLNITLEDNKILMEVEKNKLIITKKENDNMYFVAGYFDEKIIKKYENEDFKILRNPMLYTLDEVLELAFVENVKDEIENFEELTLEEQKKNIIEYVKDDELVHLEVFENKEDAEKYLKNCINDINEVDKLINNGYYALTEQIEDNEGHYHDVYEHLEERDIEDYIINSVKVGDTLLLDELINRVTSEYDNLLSATDSNDLYIDNKSVAFGLEKIYPTSSYEGWDICFEILDLNEELIEITDIYSI